MTFRPSPFLREVLLADAVLCAATGLLLAVAAGFLESFLAVPAALSRGAGLFLLPWAAALLWLARIDGLPRGAVRGVIAVNAAWALASLAILVGGWIAPNALGIAFVAAQAVVVAIVAEVQWVGMRRSTVAIA
jgi:hypothetical protein